MLRRRSQPIVRFGERTLLLHTITNDVSIANNSLYVQ